MGHFPGAYLGLCYTYVMGGVLTPPPALFTKKLLDRCLAGFYGWLGELKQREITTT